MEDSSNTPVNSQQERKCSTRLEPKNAGIARDEGPILADDVNSRTFSKKAAVKQEQVVKN